MKNPFQYGGIVENEAFCNRSQELADLRRAAENGDRLLVYAERRMGKTSLVKRIFDELPEEAYLPIYVYLWACTDADSFARAVAKSVSEAAETRTDKLLDTARSLFRHLVPSLTIDDAGNPSIQFGARSGMEVAPRLEEVLQAPATLAHKRDVRVVVAFDEIQRIADFGDDLIERTLRARVQEHSEVSYFFLGSRKHLIRHMFSDASRPLYQSAGHYPLSSIAEKHWIPFIRDRFEAAGVRIEDDAISEICGRTGGHPYYTQHFAHDLWELVHGEDTVSAHSIDEAERLLLSRLEYTYSVLWESLTNTQRKLLRGLVRESEDSRPFSSDFLGRAGLAASSAHQAAGTLMDRDIIDRDESGYIVSDRFLRLWLRRL